MTPSDKLTTRWCSWIKSLSIITRFWFWIYNLASVLPDVLHLNFGLKH